MPDGTFDPVDPMEPALRRRVRDFSDQAVVPVDAAEVARTVVRARRPRFGGLFAPSVRFGWIAAAGLLVGVIAGPALVGSLGRGPTSMGTTPSAPAAESAGDMPGCTPDDVDAVLSGLEGAAGSRYVTVLLHSTGGATCTMWQRAQPELVENGGNALIVGNLPSDAPSNLIALGPSDVLLTVVHLSNYCGPDPTELPTTIAILQGSALYVAAALSPTDTSIVPPCSGDGEPALIEMQAWKLQANG